MDETLGHHDHGGLACKNKQRLKVHIIQWFTTYILFKLSIEIYTYQSVILDIFPTTSQQNFQPWPDTQQVALLKAQRGHGGRVVTLTPPTSEAGVRFPARPQVGKLVVACRWSAVYSTEP